jgi:hypothetical protein
MATMTLPANARGSMDSLVLPQAGAGVLAQGSTPWTQESVSHARDDVPRTRGNVPFPPAMAGEASATFKTWYPTSKRDSGRGPFLYDLSPRAHSQDPRIRPSPTDASRLPPPAAAALKPIRSSLSASGADVEVLLRENDLLDRRNKLLEQEIARAKQQFAEQRDSRRSRGGLARPSVAQVEPSSFSWE